MTATSIKVGIVAIDLSSLESFLHINEGDFAAAYQAIVDDINAHGGIHGRKLDATIVKINPTSQSAASAACTQLTQDDKVFVAVGFFLADNVLCYVDTNQTATIGGAMRRPRRSSTNRVRSARATTCEALRMSRRLARRGRSASAGSGEGAVAVSLVPVPSEQDRASCRTARAVLAPDQRYCLACGQPVSPVRLAFLDVLQSDSQPYAARPGSGGVVRARLRDGDRTASGSPGAAPLLGPVRAARGAADGDHRRPARRPLGHPEQEPPARRS